MTILRIVTFIAFGCGALVVVGVAVEEVRSCLHYVKHGECRLDTVCRHGVQL